MIKRRLKFQYLLIFIGILVLIPLLTIFSLVKTNLNDTTTDEETTDFITNDTVDKSLPVVNTKTKVINPYTDQSVKVGKTYYDYKAEEESQLNSIILHEDTYIQNTGIDYIGENKFEVISILDGTVTSVKDDETIGKSVEVKHNNGYISIYQSLSEVKVKKGDIINQGQVIGTSGTNELDKDLGNHLHFEIYDNGQSVNPENYLNKEITVDKEN